MLCVYPGLPEVILTDGENFYLLAWLEQYTFDHVNSNIHFL